MDENYSRAPRDLKDTQRTSTRRMKMEKSVLKIVRRMCTGVYGGADNWQRKLLVVFAVQHRFQCFRRSFGASTMFVWQCSGAVVTLLARWQSPIRRITLPYTAFIHTNAGTPRYRQSTITHHSHPSENFNHHDNKHNNDQNDQLNTSRT